MTMIKKMLSRPVSVYLAQTVMFLLMIAWGFLLYQLVAHRLFSEVSQGPSASFWVAAFPVIMLFSLFAVAFAAFSGLLLKKSFGRWISAIVLIIVSLSSLSNVPQSVNTYQNAVEMIIGLTMHIGLAGLVGTVGIMLIVSSGVKAFFAGDEEWEEFIGPPQSIAPHDSPDPSP